MTTVAKAAAPRGVEPILWSEALAIGIPEIDEQHQELFRRVNAFFAAAWQPDPAPDLKETLGFLRRYTATHFAEEEAFMRRVGYPGLEGHAAAHRALVRHLDAVGELFSSEGASVAVTFSSLGLFRNWLLDHVAEQDRAVAAFVLPRSTGG